MTDFQLFITVLLTTLGLAFFSTGLAIWIYVIAERMREAQDD